MVGLEQKDECDEMQVKQQRAKKQAWCEAMAKNFCIGRKTGKTGKTGEDLGDFGQFPPSLANRALCGPWLTPAGPPWLWEVFHVDMRPIVVSPCPIVAKIRDEPLIGPQNAPLRS